MAEEHPLRGEPLIIYSNPDHGFIGLFGEDKKYPVYVQGETFDECLRKGEDFRVSLLERHEIKYLQLKKAARISAQKRIKRKKDKECD